MRAPGQGALQSFQQRDVRGRFFALPADPLGNSDAASRRIFDDDPNTGRTRAPMRASVHVGYEVAHFIFSAPDYTMRENGWPRKRFPWFGVIIWSKDFHRPAKPLLKQVPSV